MIKLIFMMIIILLIHFNAKHIKVTKNAADTQRYRNSSFIEIVKQFWRILKIPRANYEMNLILTC